MADSLREPASTSPTGASAVVAPTAVLVLGMHRSGTSAFTRVLNLLGVDLGSDLLRPTKDNEKGYWEHRGVVRIHERILESLDRAWSDISPLPPDWTEHDGVPALLDELQALLREEFQGERLWGVKDPRLCELLAGWKQILSPMGVRPCAAVVVRNPLDVAKSIAKRDGIPRVKALAMWLRYLLDSEIESRDVDRVFLSYETLLDDWRAAVQKVGVTLAIRWPHELDEIGADVDSFLDPSLRHNALDPVLEREDVNSHIRDAYAALVRSEWRDSQDLRAEFDRIASEVDRAGGNSGAILRAVEKEHRREAKRIEKEGRTRARKLSKAVDDFRNSGDSLRAQNDRLRSDLAGVQAEMRRLMDEARAAKRETSREAKLRNKAEKQIRRAQRLADDAAARAQALGRELHGFRMRASLEASSAPGDVEGFRSAELERARSYFDRDWYVAKYPESAAGPLDPFAYYATVGWRKGHRPSPAFDPAYYRLAEPASGDACPLIYFVAHERDSETGPNSLFDPLFYQSQLGPHELGALTPFQHYLTLGWLKNLRPHRLFDPVHYQEQAAEGIEVCPLLHYLGAGPTTDVSPHPLFHSAFYRSQLEADELGERAPLEHYLAEGWKRKLQPHPLFREDAFVEWLPPRQRTSQERLSQYLSVPALQTVSAHPLFDPDHYLAECQAIGHLPDGPLLLDYLTTGWKCGVSPHPLVDLGDGADVENQEEVAGKDPLTAYLIGGDAPGTDPHAWFDGSFYRRAYGDQMPDGISALEHFAIEGPSGEFDPIEWFDARFYLETHLSGATRINPLVHFIREGYAAGLSPNRLFVADDYLEFNPDVPAGDEPLHHWLDSGRYENRTTISTKSLLSELSSLSPPADSFDVRTFSEAEIQSLRQSLAGRRMVALFNSKADAATTEVAANLVRVLEAVAPGVTKVDCAFADRDSLLDADVYLVVAPHRTLALGDGAKFASRLDWRKTIVFNTEPIHSRFFHAVRPFLKQARLVLDANRHTAALLTKYERPVLFLPVASPFAGVKTPSTLPDGGLARGLCRATRAYDPATETSLFDRPLDLTFLGSRTSRREEFFANANRVFAEWNAVIHLATPHRFGASEDDVSAFENAIGRRTKLLLNVHLDDFPAFDWHRIVSRGIAHGAVVVSEPTLPTPVFEAGTHYLEENLRAMPDLVRWLLTDDEGRQKAAATRAAATERHREYFSAEQQGARLVSMLSPFVSLGLEPSPARVQ